MQAGKLCHRVTLEWWQKGQRTDSGATPEGWQPEPKPRWAEVEQLRDGDTTYELEGRPIDLGGKRVELELMCHELV